MSRAGMQISRYLPMLGLAVCAALAVWGWQSGVLTSQEAMEALVARVGFWGPVIFTVIQAVQVVIPILPGAIGCVVGVIMFGPLWGFVYSYVGICVGSMLAFAVAKTYGRPLLPRLFQQKTIDKYDTWTKKGKFDLWFAIAIFLPVAPDDFLCYLAGTTTMSWRRFTAIIWAGKPFAIAAYSLILNTAWTQVLNWLG